MTSAAVALTAMLSAAPAVPFEAEIDAALVETSTIYRVPKALVVAVISVESEFRPRAVSRAGAKGLMQLMPYTARRLGISEADLFDARCSVLGGVRLLAVLLRHYRGDLVSTLVAYNSGPRSLFAPVPRNEETPMYVWTVLLRTRELQTTLVDRWAEPTRGRIALKSPLPSCSRRAPLNQTN